MSLALGGVCQEETLFRKEVDSVLTLKTSCRVKNSRVRRSFRSIANATGVSDPGLEAASIELGKAKISFQSNRQQWINRQWHDKGRAIGGRG